MPKFSARNYNKKQRVGNKNDRNRRHVAATVSGEMAAKCLAAK
jgi:hypothetical protein